MTAEDATVAANQATGDAVVRTGEEGDAARPAAVADSMSKSDDFGLTREETRAEATRRWSREGVSEQVAAFRDRVRMDYQSDHPGCKRRDAHDYAWAMALHEFAPFGVDVPPPPEPEPEEPEEPAEEVEPADEPPPPTALAPEDHLTGLGDIPDDWPELPANASLAAEIQWCQANRLRVTTGSGESATVDLSQSLSPAPSHAAIGWLETSIRAYAKYCDIAAKATQNQEDEREHVRRERKALDETRGLLAEMVGET